MQTTLPQPQTHETDLPLGGHVFHGLETVKIFGRERDPETGKIETYWVINSKGRRYQVAAKLLRMKHHITSSQAAVLIEVLEKIDAAQIKSPTIMAAFNIDRHDIAKVQGLLQGLGKTNGK